MPLDFEFFFDVLSDSVVGANAPLPEATDLAAFDEPDLVGNAWMGTTHDPAGLDSFGDIDGDGIPNYADHHFGPGAHDPLRSSFANDSELAAEGSPNTSEEPGLGDSSFAEQAGAAELLAPDAASAGEWFASYGEASVTIAGDPDLDSAYWSAQEGDSSCAVACQKGVIEAITGVCIPESALAELAESCGWYDPNSGTSMNALGNLLQAHGIPVVQKSGTTLPELYDALQSGEKVIVALDANETWTAQEGPDGQPIELPNSGHAVWVTGMELQEDGSVNIVMNDTGHPDGASFEIPAEHFCNAWADYGNRSVITQTQQVSYG